jgi:hypothetical protein
LALASFIPSPSRLKELGGEICLSSRLEAGSAEKVHLGDTTSGHCGRARTDSASVETFRQARRNEDVVVCDPAARPEHPSAGSQHGELGAYSSEGVSMNDCIECRIPER